MAHVSLCDSEECLVQRVSFVGWRFSCLSINQSARCLLSGEEGHIWWRAGTNVSDHLAGLKTRAPLAQSPLRQYDSPHHGAVIGSKDSGSAQLRVTSVRAAFLNASWRFRICSFTGHQMGRRYISLGRRYQATLFFSRHVSDIVGFHALRLSVKLVIQKLICSRMW